MWDLGETNGTVALRMPRDDIALALLTEVGPMAVTSANLTGQPPATTVTDAAAQLGAAVAVYLDGGPTTSNEVSTIVDCTGESPTVLRAGAIGPDQIDDVYAASVAADAAPADAPDDASDAPTDTPDTPADPQDTPADPQDDAIELPAEPADEIPGETHER
jgi:hypothetical protein